MPRTKFKEKGGKKWIGEIDYDIEVHNKRMLRVKEIYLEEQYRGKDYGGAIMRQVIDEAKRLGCHAVAVDITKDTYEYWSPYEKRRGFFEHFGFVFDEGGGEGRLLLRKGRQKV
jgi:GNAT superfamily N-acetyltransferase